MKKLYYLSVYTILLLPSVVSAQGLIPTKPDGLPGQPSDTVPGVVTKYVELFLTFVGIITVAYIIYGGFRYITSAGNEEAAEAGKKTLTNAIIGLIIVIFSVVIVRIVSRTLGA